MGLYNFYAQIRLVHIAAALFSGGLFIARGIGVQASAAWPMKSYARYLSYSVDTLLLGAALLLLWMLPGAVFANGWLIAKLGWIGMYVVLGTYAIRRGRTTRARLTCFLAASFSYANIIAVAVTHSPLGLLAWLRR